MLKPFAITIAAIFFVLGGLPAEEEAVQTARDHLKAHLKADFETLEKTFAATVVLMPGHEFLKPDYALAGEAGRSRAHEVDQAALLRAMKDSVKDQPARPAERIDALLDSLTFEALTADAGAYAVRSSDPVDTPDSNLVFNLQEGDVLVKAAPERGDFLIFQMRQVNQTWRVVAEYLD